MSVNRLLAAVAGAAAAVILLLGWLLGVSPRLAEVAAADAETAVARQQNAALEASNATLRKQLDSIDDRRAELASLLEAVPSDAATDDFVDAVEATADGSGVLLQSLTLGEGVVYGGTPAGAVAVVSGETATAPEELAGLVTMAVEITVTGDQRSAMRFVEELQTGDRLLSVTSVLSQAGPPESTTLKGYLYVLLGDAPTGDQ
ncbi:MAG: hypothetical protein M3116_01140 [Actinomycetota bacterium]|nr:hypothetical protein [Actinomycetota bacterium]